jgi:hypothetical protein
MIAHLWAWAWADLGIEPPTLRQAFLYSAAAVLACGVLWLVIVLVTL